MTKKQRRDRDEVLQMLREGHMLSDINSYIDHDTAMKAVRINWRNLAFVPVQTNAICNEACLYNPKAYLLIKHRESESFRESQSDVMITYGCTLEILKYINNPSDGVYHNVIKSSPKSDVKRWLRNDLKNMPFRIKDFICHVFAEKVLRYTSDADLKTLALTHNVSYASFSYDKGWVDDDIVYDAAMRNHSIAMEVCNIASDDLVSRLVLSLPELVVEAFLAKRKFGEINVEDY